VIQIKFVSTIRISLNHLIYGSPQLKAKVRNGTVHRGPSPGPGGRVVLICRIPSPLHRNHGMLALPVHPWRWVRKACTPRSYPHILELNYTWNRGLTSEFVPQPAGAFNENINCLKSCRIQWYGVPKGCIEMFEAIVKKHVMSQVAVLYSQYSRIHKHIDIFTYIYMCSYIYIYIYIYI